MMNLKEILSGVDPVAVLRDLVARDELRALEPSLADLRMEMPRGVHHKDNLDHSIRVLANAIAMESEPDLVLRASALFHDIGKPATRRIGNRKSVTFDGHEVVGARMVHRILPRHGFSRAEVGTIALLVALHMRSHGFADSDWSDSAVRRLAHDAGDSQTMARLITIFKADATTKHEHKVRALHASMAALEREIARVHAVDARRALRPALDGNEVMGLTGLQPGRELGAIMRFLNSDEGVRLSRDEALEAVGRMHP